MPWGDYKPKKKEDVDKEKAEKQAAEIEAMPSPSPSPSTEEEEVTAKRKASGGGIAEAKLVDSLQKDWRAKNPGKPLPPYLGGVTKEKEFGIKPKQKKGGYRDSKGKWVESLTGS